MVSQEQDVDPDYDPHHREHSQNGCYLSSHWAVLLREARSSKQRRSRRQDSLHCTHATTAGLTPSHRHQSRARRTGASGAQLTSVAAVTDSSLPDRRGQTPAEQRGKRNRRRRTYLPSAQVLTELASLGPDLGRLADDLRDRLSVPGDEVTDLASRRA